jgi:enoyl-CoA hydratase/carnithine racemase
MTGEQSLPVRSQKRGEITIVTLDRPYVKNAVNGTTAKALSDAFLEFEKDEAQKVAVFHGAGGTFCAGADLKAMMSDENRDTNPMEDPKIGDDFDPLSPLGPMGPSRMVLTKPVIAAISGYAVAGGIELALWCDLRVVEEDAVLGVFCRRWGVPLVDGGTVRLPRLIGHSRAMDLILTGRPVQADEALQMGLANRVVPKGQCLQAALELAQTIAKFPQTCMRNDRLSAYEQWDHSYPEAMANEFEYGKASLLSPELREGVGNFVEGKGRGGSFE